MIWAVLSAAFAMILTRFLAYWFLKDVRSPLLSFLQKNMGLVIMVVLIFYTLSPYEASFNMATFHILACAFLALVLQIWLKSPLISIVLPTCVYILLVNY